MAAVPPGPDSGSRAEMISFHGNRCSVSGEPENLGGNLQDSVVTDTGQKPDVCGCKLERGNNRDYPLSELNHQCETLERRINGFSCIGVSGFIHNHTEDESFNELKAPTEHCDRSSCDQNASTPEHKLVLPYQDINQKSDNSIVTFSRSEASQTHANIGHDLGNKVKKCYLRTDQGPEVTPQTVSDADGPVLEMCRLDLNHSPATEVNQSQDVVYVHYESELQMPGIMRLITKDLSEPYSIYTYRYFIHNWPQLCFLAMVKEVCVGAIVCKLDMHKKMFRRGYIAMLAVDSEHRRKNIGTNLVKKAIYAMVEGDCDKVE
ncbi:hypothetical protein QTP86_021457 [Hemibagrus guttatus]|nr:hypothetical protein QTP86_021457 [Hemibagrus guttatus]